MKKLFVLVLTLALLLTTACSSTPASTTDNGVDPNFVLGMSDTILDFDPESAQPSDSEIERMLKAAVKAPSGRNLQKYWITVITDYETQMKLALTPETRPQEGTVLFIYSVPAEENPSSINVGISYGYLNAQAQLDGYATHIYTQPAGMLDEMGAAEEFGIPDGYQPDQFILVGKPLVVDGKTASTPGDRESKWNFFEPLK